MKCLKGAVVGCVISVILLSLAATFAAGDSLAREFAMMGAVGYAPYVAIIGAVIGGLIGAIRVPAGPAHTQRQTRSGRRY
jgi:hypothetical protein